MKHDYLREIILNLYIVDRLNNSDLSSLDIKD